MMHRSLCKIMNVTCTSTKQNSMTCSQNMASCEHVTYLVSVSRSSTLASYYASPATDITCYLLSNLCLLITNINEYVFSVVRMMAIMQDRNSEEVPKEFLETGRTGRRNAMPDILHPQGAEVTTADLPSRLQQLVTTGKCTIM